MTMNPLFVAVYRETYPSLPEIPSCGACGAAMDDFLAALSALTAPGPHGSEPYEHYASDEPYICGICMESGGCSYTLSCQHTACRACMVRMALTPHLAFSCPFCRVPLDKDKIMNDIDNLTYLVSIPAFDAQLYPRAPPFEVCSLDEGSRYMISRAYHVIYNMNAWETLRTYVSRAEEGFSFTTNASILEIMRNIYKDNENHSGISLGYTMRQMHYIAVFGFSAYQTMLSQ